MPFKAKVDRPCVICNEIIYSGTITIPLTNKIITNNNNNNKPSIIWAHEGCISPDDERVPICKHWKTKGVCIFRNKCQFRHPENDINTEIRSRSRHGTWGRKRIYNEGRASSLRRWLLNVFGIDYLKSGSGVMDVAGGKGEVSFELLNLNGIQSTVNDPRPLDLYRYKRKLEFGFYHRNEMLECYNPQLNLVNNSNETDKSNSNSNSNDNNNISSTLSITTTSTSSTARICYLPQHIRTYFEMYDSYKSGSLLNQLKSLEGSINSFLPLALESPEEFLIQIERSQQTKWTKKGLQHENDDQENDNQEDENQGEEDDENNEEKYEDNEDITDISSCQSNIRTRDMEGGIEINSYEDACNIVKNCSIVIGMHPDQAVEHIIDFALLNKKPFAVIPCCVYHRQFPHRHLSTGAGGYVRRYGELIEYLIQKDPSIHALEMDFEGKNVMLYSLGDYKPLSNPNESIPHICKGIATSEHWWKLSNSEQSKRSAKLCNCNLSCNDINSNSNSNSNNGIVNELKKNKNSRKNEEIKKMDLSDEIFEGMSNLMNSEEIIEEDEK